MLYRITCIVIFSLFVFTSQGQSRLSKKEDPKKNLEVKLTQEAYYPKGDNILYKYVYKNLNLDKPNVPEDLNTDVTLIFTVLLDSTIREFRVLSDPSGLFEEPMTRLFNGTRFVPSEENGVPVVTKVLLKVPFKYENVYVKQDDIIPVR